MSRLFDWTARGLRSAQPAAALSNKGMLYFVTDEGVTERSSGSAWEAYSGSIGGTSSGGGGRTLVDNADSIAANTSWDVPECVEINSTGSLDVEGRLEIIGGRAMQCYLDMSIEGQPATLQVSNEGTIDWLNPGGFNQYAYVGAVVNSKKTGGWLQQGFMFIGFANSLLNQAATMLVTSTAGDNLADNGSVLTANNGSQGVFHASTVGLGFRFRLPCRSYLQVLRIYPTYFSCKMKYVAQIIGGNVPDQTFEIAAPPNGTRLDKIKVAYSGTPDMELLVTAYQTANYGFTPNVKMQTATIART